MAETITGEYDVPDYSDNDSDYNFNISDNGSYEKFIHHFETRPERQLIPAVMAIVFVVGMIGNVALIFVFLRETKYVRVTPNALIFSLAVSDLLVVLFSAPHKVIEYLVFSYPFSKTVCKIAESLEVVSFGVSAFTLAALSAWCFFEVRISTRTLQDVRRQLQARRFTIVAIVCIWILSISLAVPTMSSVRLIIFNFHIENTHMFVCMDHHHHEFELIRIHLHCAIPVVIVGCFYILTRRLKNGTGTIQHQTQAQSEFARFIFTLALIYGIFSVLSYVATITWFLYDSHSHTIHFFYLCSYLLTFSFHCFSPIAFYCCSSGFRNLISRHLPCLCCVRNQVSFEEDEGLSLQSVESALH